MFCRPLFAKSQKLLARNCMNLQCLLDPRIHVPQTFVFTMFGQPLFRFLHQKTHVTRYWCSLLIAKSGYQNINFCNGKSHFPDHQKSRSRGRRFYNVWSTFFCEKAEKMLTKHCKNACRANAISGDQKSNFSHCKS